MAILDNFEIIVLTNAHLDQTTKIRLGTEWAEVKEYQPPGCDAQSSHNTCRKYIGVPPLQSLGITDRVNTEFVIDYKVKCGFEFADQRDTGAEYIVFRTYLDDEKIGSASVKRQRWERSGSYRIRKQGKRYRIENEQKWIRQRWMFDPGLHGTIKVEVWRERTKIPVMTDWGLIDLTVDEDLVVGQDLLPVIFYEKNVKRPRVKHLVKLDLLPIATFEFEYRSEDTLRILGLTESVPEEPIAQHEEDKVFEQENNELWKTFTNSSSGGTTDTMMDTLLSEMDVRSSGFEILHNHIANKDTTNPSLAYTDAIGRCLLTGTKVPNDVVTPPICPGDLTTQMSNDDNSADAIPDLEHQWWDQFNTPVKTESPSRHGGVELVDLTMLD